ncbi:unnamed protein product [Schistosoma rodhaini]|uniref:Solute carrier family 25 member 51 n=1 Tax=Schistosoma rodhaini TaxID=6188 RepID=A0AA85G571_9TREM|nr:unnamed protein product [Schistosoma rodhaini]CAH8673754.1 unnamed protein product [Schistosoma rodhaini]
MRQEIEIAFSAPQHDGHKANPPHCEFLFGAAAYSVSVVVLFPLYKTIFFQQLDGIPWIQALIRYRIEGIRMAYRGVLPPLLQRASSGALMFGVQSSSERFLVNHPATFNYSPTLHKIVSSALAGWSEAVLMPFERVQTLLQNKDYHDRYKNTFHALINVTSNHGVKELYRGLSPVLVRNSAANGLYFCGHKWLNDIRVRRTCESTMERSLWNFALGGILGGTIGMVTFPLNVIKTRMQSNVGGSFNGFRPTLVSLVYEDSDKPNILRLFRGVPANFIRSVFSWGLITMTFHFLLEINSMIC